MKEVAIFGAGCFWGIQEKFNSLKGVTKTTVGYAGGHAADPTYQQVCSGQTGHAEVVQVEFDPSIISYEDLLKVFWQVHNPTTLNRQGPDIGSQYRSLILYTTKDQEQKALEQKRKLEQSEQFPQKIVTEILPASDFFQAEEYHQHYLAKQKR